MTPTVCITFDYHLEAYTVAFPMLVTAGLVGTYFVDPDTINTATGPSRDNLTLLKMCGWTIGAYSGLNMVDTLSNNRNTAMDRFVAIRNKFLGLGFNPRSLAPNQRAWDNRLRNLADGLFERVRVACDFTPQPLPVPDPLYIKNGGTGSLGNADTAASLNANVDAFLAQSEPGLWSIVVHKVGPVPDGYTVENSVFAALLTRLAAEQTAGKLRVVGYDNI